MSELPNPPMDGFNVISQHQLFDLVSGNDTPAGITGIDIDERSQFEPQIPACRDSLRFGRNRQIVGSDLLERFAADGMGNGCHGCRPEFRFGN